MSQVVILCVAITLQHSYFIKATLVFTLCGRADVFHCSFQLPAGLRQVNAHRWQRRLLHHSGVCFTVKFTRRLHPRCLVQFWMCFVLDVFLNSNKRKSLNLPHFVPNHLKPPLKQRTSTKSLNRRRGRKRFISNLYIYAPHLKKTSCSTDNRINVRSNKVLNISCV